jgi:hypothetical protein
MSTGVGSKMRPGAACCGLALVALLALVPGAGAGVSIGPSTATPTVAYVMQSGNSQPVVWTIHVDGTQNTRIGPGFTPLISPSAQQIAASLFGANPSNGETGPALAVYSTSGGTTQTYFNLAGETVEPLAWSRDDRYVAVDIQSTKLKNAARLSGLGVVDTMTGTTKVIARGQIFGASFAPNGSDEIVYGRSAAQTLTAPVNVFRSTVDGSGTTALTRDGRSLFPLWGPKAIVYDRERLRREDAPVYQLWLRSPSGKTRRLTNIRVRTLVSGLTPLAFSADGSKLLAQFVGQDTNEAWTVSVASGRARRLTPRSSRYPLQAAGMTSDGTTLLVNEGGVDGPASEGRVATLPFAGGRSTILVAHGAQASWNG